MKYEIFKLEKISEDGVEVKQLLTLQVTYSDGSTTLHGKYVDLETDVREEALTYAAELDRVLEEPRVVTTEDIEVLQTIIKAEDVAIKKQALLEKESNVIERSTEPTPGPV